MFSNERRGLAQAAYEYGLRPCAIAVVFVLVALLWTFPLQHWIDYPFVFLFFGAIMGSAWFGGRIAGLIAVVVSSFLVTYFFIPPLYSIKVAAESQSFLAAFILFAITMSFVSSARKQAEIQVREARDSLELRVQERTAELERSHRDIQQSERQLRLLTEAIPQQIWRARADGEIDYVNQNLRQYLGSAEEALLGNRLFQAVHPQDAPALLRARGDALNSGDPFEAEARVLNGTGDYRWFLIRVFPQRSDEGQIAHWYGLHIDIEDRQREQQTRTRRQENLSRLSRSLSMSEVAASIAHELNQPMTAVMTHSYACLEWASNTPPNFEKVRASAEKIVQESTRAGAVVRRVRALFSNDDPVHTACDINRLIEDSASLLRDDAIREGVKIELRLASDLPMVEIDAVQIQQVIFNLAKNSIEAMAGSLGGLVLTIATSLQAAPQPAIMIAVQDTGPGIPAEAIENIFEPFFSTKKHGTGIGLAICRSIVESHNGHIFAANGSPVGAIVQFTLPLNA